MQVTQFSSKLKFLIKNITETTPASYFRKAAVPSFTQLRFIKPIKRVH